MKTPEEIIKQYSTNPAFGYGSSWIIPAMKEYAKQYIDEAADRAMYQAENGWPVGDAVYELKNLIDKQ